jgi:hypothetical protein
VIPGGILAGMAATRAGVACDGRESEWYACVTYITARHRESAQCIEKLSWRRTVVTMPSPRNTSVSAARAINVAIGLVEQQEERLRDILESKQSTPEEKFDALVRLARLAGIMLHEVSEAEETPRKR